MALLTNGTITFDGYANEASITDGSMTRPWYTTGSTAPVALTAAALHGDRGAQITGATAAVKFEYRESQTTATRCISAYFRLITAPESAVYMGGMLDTATNRADWRINSDHTVTIRDANVATGGGASSEALATNTWYRYEWWTATTGQELRIYEGESPTPYITRTGALTDNSHTIVSGGLTTSPTGWTVQFDTVRIGNDWIGAFAPAIPLDTPEDFTFTSDPHEVKLTASWSAVAGADHYELEIQKHDGEGWEAHDLITPASSPTVITAGLDEGTTYRARVRAMPDEDSP